MTEVTLVSTFCRICEPLCPLVAEVDGRGTVLALHPDREHPVSGGFACHKGTSYHRVHHDPNRLDHPLRRVNPKSEPRGRFERVSWEEALADIGERILREAGASKVWTELPRPAPTRQCGGTRMGSDPKTSVVNR